MSRIFLSHSSGNNGPAVVLRDWLADGGWDDVFLDLDPKRGIVAGERWERALREAAYRCEAVLFLVSRAWLASDWCIKEYHLAAKLNKRMFGVLIEDIAIKDLPGELTATWQMVNLTQGADHAPLSAVMPDGREEHVTFSRGGLQQLKAGLIKAGLDPRFFAWPPATDPNRPPYRGLLPMEADDAGIFFGREAHIIETLDKLRGLRQVAASRLLVVLGASGSGKSSFLRAGILPRLARDDRNFIVLPVIRPERAVISGEAGLLRSLEKACEAQGIRQTRAEIKKLIAGGADDILASLASLACKTIPPKVSDEPEAKPPTLVLAVDQGEELFQAEGGDESQAFRALLKDLLSANDSNVIVIMTIRSDAYASLQAEPQLKDIHQQPLNLPPVARGAYQAVIEGPAVRLKDTNRSLAIDPKLTAALLSDIEAGAAKDALPLLAFTLERLYLEHGGDGDLKLEEYREIGGITGSIEAAVKQALRAADADPTVPKDGAARLALMRRAFIPWLAGIDPDTGSPRRSIARFSDIPEESRPLVKHLIEQRLLATDRSESDEQTIEPAHEALLRQWGLLKGWLAEDFVQLAALEGVRRATRDWLANGRSANWLAHGAGRLEDAEKLKERPDLSTKMAKDEQDYLALCRKAETERKDKELRQARRFAKAVGTGLAATVLLAIIAAGFAYYGFDKAADAEQALKSLEQGQALVDMVVQNLRPPTHSDSRIGNLQKITSLFGEARDAGDSRIIDSAHKATWLSLLSVHELSRFDYGDGVENQLFAADFSADGSRILTVNEGGVLRQWSLGNVRQSDFERALGPPDASGKAEAGRSLRVSSIGDLAAVGFRRGSVVLVDLKSRAEKTALLSKDGLSPHGGPVMDLVFSSDGSLLVTSSLAGELVIWQRPDDTAKAMNSSTVDPLGWTPVRIVDWKKEYQSNGIWQKEDQADNSDTAMQIWSVDVSLDKRMVAFGLGNGRVCLQRLDPSAKLSLVCSKEGHLSGKAVKAVKFQPNAPILASAGNDDRITIWNFTPDSLGATPLKIFQDNDIWDLDFSTDGTLLATAGWDGSIRVFESSTGRPIVTMDGHTSAIRSVRFDRSSRKLVTASLDHTARVWTPFASRINLLSLSYLFPFDNSRSRPQVYSVALGAGGDWVTFETGNSVFLKEADKPPVELPSRVSVDLVSSRDTWPQSKLNFHQVLAHPTENTVLASALEPVVLAWSKSSEEWSRSSTITPLPGEKVMGGMRPLALSPSSMWLAIAIWEGGKSSVLLCPRTGNGQIWACSEASAKRIPLTSIESSRRPLECRKPSMALPQALDFSSNGRLLAVAQDDCTVSIYDVDTQARVKGPYIGHIGRIISVDFSPDDSTILSASSDWTARIWRLADDSSYLIKHNAAVNGAVFSPSGKWVATVSSDETLKVSYASTGKELLALPIEQDSILSADLKNTPHGAIMATGSAGGTINTIHFFDRTEETYKHATAFLKESIGLDPSQNAP